MVSTAEELIKKQIDKLGPQITKEQRQSYEETLLKIFKGGQSPQQAMGLSDEMLEEFYGYAYRFYNAGNYADSQSLFQFLVTLDASRSKYALGLAASMHMQKKYQAAIEVYMLAAFYEQESPVPFFHIADCYLKLNQPYEALLALDDAIRLGFYPRYSLLRSRAILMRKKIRDELGLPDTPPPIKDYLISIGCDVEGVDIDKLFINGAEEEAKFEKALEQAEGKKASSGKTQQMAAGEGGSQDMNLEPGRPWEPPTLEL
ncbi:SycD/LcrH family type III secretion system chaperone [Parachlamydia sp. AcF125]|uniref:SycD/LcrH family type III secretion system chaperone n=1 Tax=Parachlamydia sp. AcF125 TaxID=2795736 RepID=UPI001BC912F3|nr:SycD/LcrH family type III secretion system chaperone [Parachlamydia sp. AcF125]MBS4168096.1 Chaperone protein IpgC [Parachlamydia sp. AcF125]